MRLIISSFCVMMVAFSWTSIAAISDLSFESLRDKIMETEKLSALGGGLWLSEKEEKANTILMHAKKKEIDEGCTKPGLYPPGMHFFQAKPLIRQSEVFRIIQKMPKGAFLHGHSSGIVSSKWVIRNLTAQFNLYMCKDKNNVVLFTFKNLTRCVSEMKNICVERLNTQNRSQYDRQMEKHINMYTMHPEKLIQQNQKIWKRFENIFDTVDGFYKYMPIYRAYNLHMMEEFLEDNIIYAEIRAPLSALYGDNNVTYSPMEVVEELEGLIKSFKKSNPEFIGMKVIYSRRNKASNAEMSKRIDQFKELHTAKPNLVIGFDLYGQEDLGEPLYKYANEFFELPNTANFFFHAGETKWQGRTDWNMMDAILLNTKRIGHGYALFKHPHLWQTVKKRDIAIEVSPISNQVMGLVWDLRNHPAAFYMSEDLPVVITADDPGVWNAKGLSYDFYYAFMAMSPIDADLKTLKQLALNSIKHSVLTSEERRKINHVFKRRWDIFIENVIHYRF